MEKLDLASLEELQGRFPAEWKVVGARLVAATATRRPEAMVAFMTSATAEARSSRSHLLRHRGPSRDLKAGLLRLAAARMALLAVDQALRAAAALAASGKRSGDVQATGAPGRFGLWSGTQIQRLMFAHDLERKPVSMAAFRLLWPLIPQRSLLMPLVQPRGIYCFYSGALIRALAKLVGPRTCLELAAGDGTLTRFLSRAGVDVHAVDDRSWSHAITYSTDVENVDAGAALRRDRPSTVICSFPPPRNVFEREIFLIAEVELYIVLTTRHRFAAGDWEAYEQQHDFNWSPAPGLARLLLPPELDPAVLMFRRTGVQ